MQNSNLFAIAQTLISYPSITPNGDQIFSYIENYLANLGFQNKRLDRNGICNLFAVYGNKHNPVITFAGHVDVVHPGDTTKWQFPPFNLTKFEDKLYGRGIADMKGAIACFLFAIEKFIAINKEVSIAIILTSDEEGEAKDGTIAIVEYLQQQNILLNYCVIGEPTSEVIIGDVIKNGRRGSLNATVEVFGKQGHVAYPTANPIHQFAPVMDELINTSWDLGNKDFPPTVLQFTNITSGLGLNNVTPGALRATFNFRYNNLQTVAILKQRVTTIFAKHNLAYNTLWSHSAEVFLTEARTLLSITQEVVDKITAIKPTVKTNGGTSDGRFLYKVCNELIELGLRHESAHQINENIAKDDLVILANIYYQILNKVFND